MPEQLVGYGSLMHRLQALESPRVGAGIMRRLAIATVAEAKREVPRKTGNLGRSIHVGAIGPSFAEVRASASYAAFVEFGTRPHEIRPVRAKALRWAATAQGRRLTGSVRTAAARGGMGGVVFARVVHHPGTRPHPFMEPAAQRAIAAADLLGVVVATWNGAGGA